MRTSTMPDRPSLTSGRRLNVPGPGRGNARPRLAGLMLLTALVSTACARAVESRPARAPDPPADYSWPTFGGDPAHVSVDLGETVIDTSSVRHLTRTWSVELP